MSKAERSDFHILELWIECDYFAKLQEYADSRMSSTEEAATWIIESYFYARDDKDSARGPKLVTR